LKGQIESKQRGTISEVESRKPVTVTVEMAVEAGYDTWNAEINRIAVRHAFIRYNTLLATVQDWTKTRTSLVAHVGTVLAALSTLGTRDFFSRKKRFAFAEADGDIIFCDLSDEGTQQAMNRLKTVLMAVKGEGLKARNAGRAGGTSTQAQETEEQSGNDTALAIANALVEFQTHIDSDLFLKNHCFTQDQFEARYNLKWSGK